MTAEAEARKLRKEAKMQARRAQLALSRQDHGGPQAWRGWFDGSAHPNPGKLGIGALLLGPDGAGLKLQHDGQEITLITPHAPLGRQLLGQGPGDQIQAATQAWQVLRVE